MSVHGYPRPQLVRKSWLSLDGQWDFTFDNSGNYSAPEDDIIWSHQITVPYPPESIASGVADRGLNKICWYRKTINFKPTTMRTLLHFGAVDYQATVWVNGKMVAKHEGGHTPFMADITTALNPTGEQIITVQVEDDPLDLAKPRGKQDWQKEPHSIWYPRTTGIWQSVWLEEVPMTYIGQLRWTPDLDSFSIGCDVHTHGDSVDNLTVGIKIWHKNDVLANDRYQVKNGEMSRCINLADPGIDDARHAMLWSPENPILFDAEVSLWEGDTLVDTITSYTALRSVRAERDRFMLNGRPYTLRLVLDQGYWNDTLLAAPNDEAYKRDVELTKMMGFNGVRKHQKIESPRYMYWADKLGLLMWEEMPSAYRFSDKTIPRLTAEWMETINRDYSHPCVVAWVPFNESWGVPNLPTSNAQRSAVKALYHLTKSLDATRLVIGNDGWEATETDLLTIHDYDCNPESVKSRYALDAQDELFKRRRPGYRMLTLDGHPYKGQPILLTEFGGISFVPELKGNEQAWGYSKAATIEEFRSNYEQLLKVVNETELFAGFCYTQFADTFTETNGLLYGDRRPKFDIEQIAAGTLNRAAK